MATLKLIGKGAFSKVYDYGDNQVLIHTNDLQKACYAEWGIDSSLVPEIERLWDDEHLPYKDGYYYYVSPKYRKVRAFTKELKPNDLELYRKLRMILNGGSKCNYNHLHDQFVEMGLDEMILILDSLCNYISITDIRFEISPRNIAINDNGDMILLDCFYCQKTLNENKYRKI